MRTDTMQKETSPVMDEEGFADPMRSIPRRRDETSKDFLWYSEAWSAYFVLPLGCTF